MSSTSQHLVSIGPMEGYDLWAQSYDVTPNTVVACDDRVFSRFFGPVGGAVIVDAGCGTGRHTRRLAQDGCAQHVHAVDFSREMLAQAQQKCADCPNVSFYQGDLCQLTHVMAGVPLADGIVCALVGEHIADLPLLFAQLRQRTKTGGWLAFSVYHPLLALSGVEANFNSGKDNVSYQLGAFPHLVSHYYRAMRTAGFDIDIFEEVIVDDELVAQLPKAIKWKGKPVLLILRGTAV